MNVIEALNNTHLDNIVMFDDEIFIVVGIQMLSGKPHIPETIRPYYYLSPIDGILRVDEDYRETVSGQKAICIPHERITFLTEEQQKSTKLLYT